MIKLEPIKGIAYIARFYEDNAFDTSDRPPFIASCVLEYDLVEDKVLWIKNLQGIFNRKLLKQLVGTLNTLGIEKAKAMRVEGHTLPFSKVNEAGEHEMSVIEATKKLKL